MKVPESAHPVKVFPIPPGAPAPVLAADERFRAVVDELELARDELQAAKTGVKDAPLADARRISDAVQKGKPISYPDKTAREADEHLRATEARVKGLELAVHDSGNALAAAIDRDRAGWAEDAAQGAEKAEADLLAAIESVQDAAARLQVARGTVDYLDRFRLSDAVVGRQQAFVGGPRLRATLKGRVSFNDDGIDAATILSLARALATDPEPRHLSRAERDGRTPSQRQAAREAAPA